MAEPFRNPDDTRPIEEVNRHDALCDRYEAALRAGTPVALADVLAEVPEAERPTLFVLLVRVAWDCIDPPPTDDELRRQFPQYADLLAVAAADRGPRERRPTVPGCEVGEKIGEGGMGVVYLARDTALDRTVAVKVIRSGAPPTSIEGQRFGREMKAAGKLSHPRVVRVLRAGWHAGQAYCVMDYVPGGTLARRIAGKPFDPRGAADLLAAVADGVQHIHSQGIIHRDLKPGNVLMDADDQPCVADFGLARLLGDGHPQLTKSWAVLGTAGYMAPEVAGGEGRSAGPAADVYSLGAILFELLTGRPPFREANFELTLVKVLTDDPPRPSDLVNGVPPDLEAVCLKCLQKEPARRYATAAEVAADLRRWLAGESVSARPLSDFEANARWAHRVGFDLVTELGCDRWAYTYAAVQPATGRQVVLLVCNTRAGEPARIALCRQANVLAGLSHTNLVRLIDYVDTPAQPYLVLDQAHGTPLARPLHPGVASNIANQIAAGLQAVHDRGMLHLGVCPAAIGVTEDGIPRLSGFGSARPVGAPLDDLVPRVGGLSRANYTAPEVLARKRAEVGFTADVFALGAVLYELLAGRPPFHTPTLAATREWVLSRRPPAPLPAGVPAALADLCLDCLAKRPADRPARAFDVAARLGTAGEESTITEHDAPRPSGVSFRLRVDCGPVDEGRTHHFRQACVKVGRFGRCDLTLPSCSVSKHHFTIQWHDESRVFLLTDNASKNGVAVNGKRVVGSRILTPGDHIRVAEYRLTFEPG